MIHAGAKCCADTANETRRHADLRALSRFLPAKSPVYRIRLAPPLKSSPSPGIGTRKRGRFAKARPLAPPARPFLSSLVASQIVYPACTMPSTRRILYYRVEYLMRPATLGTRGKKFAVPPLPRDISPPDPRPLRLLLL